MTRKILAICQSGGEFVTKNDETMSYVGGEAHAIDIDYEMSLKDLESEMSDMFNLEIDTFSIKYFLLSNTRILITLSCDQDLQRMVDLQADSPTTDVYVLKKAENRRIRSTVADSGTPTDATTATEATLGDAKRQRLSCDWDSIITGVGQVFDNKWAFHDALQEYAISNHFTYRFTKNDVLCVTAECTAENCPWSIHASWSPASQEFMIMRMSGTHTCEMKLSNEGQCLASQRWVASVKRYSSRNYKPKKLAHDRCREYGLSFKYSQVWREKIVAKKKFHSSLEQACNKMPHICERIVETNPGSVATLVTSEDSKFRLFIAFHASLSGFELGCRPLLFLDDISLQANKQWKLLVATAVDGENDIFPVAFAIVEMQTSNNWNWFLVQLKSALSKSLTITFISNGQDGLEEDVPQVFQHSHHGYCVRHLIEDFISKFKESYTQKVKDALVGHIMRAVHALTLDEFNESIDSIKIESKELADWVLSTKPDRWSNAFFKGMRSGRYSSNAAEMFNDWISAITEPPVVQMIDTIRCKMMEMLYARRESSNTWTEKLTPSMNRKVQEEITKSRSLHVTYFSGSVFKVCSDSINFVNIETWECTCRRWQVIGLPCLHALAVCKHTNGCIYDYCSEYFTTKYYRITYSLPINPIPGPGTPGCVDPVYSTDTWPPCTLR